MQIRLHHVSAGHDDRVAPRRLVTAVFAGVLALGGGCGTQAIYVQIYTSLTQE